MTVARTGLEIRCDDVEHGLFSKTEAGQEGGRASGRQGMKGCRAGPAGGRQSRMEAGQEAGRAGGRQGRKDAGP